MPLHCIENCDDPMECPLCMEAFEMDDLSFYPCTCGYQICRFCWHRIRTDENGLCPACRKAYAENPADFKPLSSQELAKIKAEKKQKDHAKKQKAYENRKHLQNVRVVQNNLVFVVGLPPKMADPDVLKRTEYFGRFGKIHKVVLNHANHYAGQQVSGHKGPSCSAYVTYVRSDDALRAIQAVNNFCVDGRTLKASLGTTKYCSHFMKNQSCPKGDCMYLHEIGDESASFTKEDMQLGKHQEYERKLHESLIQSTMQQQQPGGASQPKETRTSISPQLLSTSAPEMSVSPNTKAGAWPSLDPATQHNNNKGEKGQNTKAPQQKSQKSGKSREKQQPKPSTSLPQQSRLRSTSRSPIELNSTQEVPSNPSSVTSSTLSLAAELDTVAPDEILTTGSSVESKEFVPDTLSQEDSDPGSSNSGLPSSPAVNIPFSCISVDLSETRVRREESQSFFSSETFHVTKTVTTVPPGWSSNGSEDSGISDSLSNGSTNDWNIGAREDGALDLNSSPPPEPKADDDLGFDPFHETQKALAELVEKESLIQRNSGYQQQMGYSNMGMFGATQQRSRLPPPGFNPPGFNPPGMGLGLSNLPRMNQSADLFGSKLLSFRNTNSQLGSHPLGFGSGLGMTQPPQRPAEPPSMLGLNGLGLSGGFMQHSPQPMRPQQQPHTPLYGRAPEKDPYSVKEWQDRLKNLFPNINVTTGPMQSQPAPPPRFHSQMFGNQTQTDPSKAWRNPSSDWSAMDPAILSTGQLTERPDSPPHWLRSLEQLTEGGSQFGLPPPNHHLGNHQRHENTMWNPHPSHFGFGNQIGTAPPPGFSHMRLPKQMEAQKLIDNM